MFNINNYLKKFTFVENKDKKVKVLLIEVVKNSINLNLEEKNISLNNNIIYIKASPAIKSLIFIKKENILSSLREKTDFIIKDIK
ncbi:MAG: hypothetical protein Q7R78_00425 [bacterium]|nr:hypothetical protein [bacterium]